MLNESRIISQLKSRFPRHIGDDAAVIPYADDNVYVISKDVLVEHVHFRRTYGDEKSLARKVLHVNLSDLAAMCALPVYVMLGLSIPLDVDAAYLDRFLQYFSDECEQAHVQLIGGDTTRSDRDFFISVTVIGIANKHEMKKRDGARAGDVLAVLGNVGHAHLGFQLLEHACSGFDDYKQAFLKPTARIKEGLWLGKQSAVHACMDLSDGLLVDAERMADASQLAVFLDANHDEPDQQFIEASALIHEDPKKIKLIGGEDYGLLLAIDPDSFLTISEYVQQTFHETLKKAGHFSSGKGIQVFPEYSGLKPFTHFGE